MLEISENEANSARWMKDMQVLPDKLARRVNRWLMTASFIRHCELPAVCETMAIHQREPQRI